jgi:hypothetical protein
LLEGHPVSRGRKRGRDGDGWQSSIGGLDSVVIGEGDVGTIMIMTASMGFMG